MRARQLKHDRGWSDFGPSWQGFGLPEEAEPLCIFYWAIWGASETDVFLVGENGNAAHYDGTQWSFLSPGAAFTDELHDVWGSSGSDVFAVGGDYWGNIRSTIIHYDGTAWTTMVDSETAATAMLNGVWGAAPDDVFAVGYEGAILHYDGVDWSRMESGTAATLNSVGGTSGSDVWVAGSEGLLHYDGTAWSPVVTGTSGPLRSVQVVPRGAVFALGDGVLVKGSMP